MTVPIADGEAILRREKREISILVASEDVTITHARYAAGEQVAGPHVHHEHTDAFYVLEGELTFEIGRGVRDGVDVEWDISAVPTRRRPPGKRSDRPIVRHASRGRWSIRSTRKTVGWASVQE